MALNSRYYLLASLLLTFIISLGVGSTHLNFLSLFDPANEIDLRIILDLRFPRVLAAFVVGWALGLSGYVTQSIFANPLASPGLLGTSASASLAVLLCVQWFGASYAPLASIVGAMGATFLLISFSKIYLPSKEKLLLIGFCITSAASALSSLILALNLGDFTLAQSLIRWTMGSFQGVQQNTLVLPACFTLLITVFIYRQDYKIKLLQFQDIEAMSMGLSIQTFRTFLILEVSVLIGLAVHIAGPISFIGLIAPHLTRIFWQAKSSHLSLLSAAVGSLLLMISDTVGRCVVAPLEIDVGIITTIVGTPLLWWFILRKKQHVI